MHFDRHFVRIVCLLSSLVCAMLNIKEVGSASYWAIDAVCRATFPTAFFMARKRNRSAETTKKLNERRGKEHPPPEKIAGKNGHSVKSDF